MQYLSLKELCAFLSVSPATGRNWLAQGKLCPSKISGKTSFFSMEYAETYRNQLLSAKGHSLKSRRNKAYVSGNSIYASYLSADSPNQTLAAHLSSHLADAIPDEELLSLLLAECALRLFAEAALIPTVPDAAATPLLSACLTSPDSFFPLSALTKELIPDKMRAKELLLQREALFLLPVSYVPLEDTLGFFYLSLRQLNRRKASGAYYTPIHIVERLLSELAPAMQKALQNNNRTFSVLDPSCGTGNFLLHLPKNIPLAAIYGTDTDSIAVTLTRINLLLRQLTIDTHNTASGKKAEESSTMWHIRYTQYIHTLWHNIRTADFLLEDNPKTYAFILGNPPWGSLFSKEEKLLLRRRFTCASYTKPEAYDLFLEQGIQHLALGGFLSFVLPEAVLTVKAHTKIRSLLLSVSSIRFLTHLGNCFDGVFCPSVVLTLEKTELPHSCIGMRVTTPEQKIFTIKKERELSADGFCLFSEDASYALTEKLLTTPNCVYLKNNADFALGIVTGDNRTKLRPVSADPAATGTQGTDILQTPLIPVLCGPDILPYHIAAPSKELTVPLSACQQAAPESLYHAPEKLLYRFISERLIFAYDDKQHIPLNSCNIVIPHFEGLSMPYILAVLNSRCMQFLYHEKFRSLKVLRSHLEQLPIPQASKKEQEEILPFVTLLQKEPYGTNTWQSAYEQLEQLIFALFHLTEAEISLIS